jgi:uncharacterized protein YceK
MLNRFLMLILVIAVLGCSTVDSTRSGRSSEGPSFRFRWDGRRQNANAVLAYENVLKLLDAPQPMLAL